MKAILTAIFLSGTLLTSIAEARQIYWTGHGDASVYDHRDPIQACENTAYYDADAGVRESCVRDFGYHPRTCQRARVSNVQYLGSRHHRGYVTCSVRVYLELY